MAGAIAGALHGDAAIRPAWIARMDEANRVDLGALAADLATLTASLQRRRLVEAVARARHFAALGAGNGVPAAMELLMEDR
jgi:hypothetical protein